MQIFLTVRKENFEVIFKSAKIISTWTRYFHHSQKKEVATEFFLKITEKLVSLSVAGLQWSSSKDTVAISP